MAYQLPPASTLHTLSKEAQVEVLDHLFEPCATLAELVISRVLTKPFSSYQELIETSRSELLAFLEGNSESPKVSKIISAHPRLGPSKDKLSSHSSSEQKSLAGTEEEARKLAALNDAYEAAFPGLRYVVFVNGRSREEVMKNMTLRINRGDIQKERAEAFEAMCDIAWDRAKKLSRL